ncbi:hypothetical protein EYF80_039345 [Liparis tanakae]|uniref:Uncharacterized protein n=1 Tax=Liparis tanakae TaxID=230148 RepID=A0A4Z2GAG9_9TELE|nr:hypothetical protein EYF80_039345 [Liparis tanakae]
MDVSVSRRIHRPMVRRLSEPRPKIYTGRQKESLIPSSSSTPPISMPRHGGISPLELLVLAALAIRVDHEEHAAVRRVLLGAGVGHLVPSAASDGGQQLAVPLRVLQVLQGDHVGQAQFAAEAEAEAVAAAPRHEAADADQQEEEGDGCKGDEGDGPHAHDGLAGALALAEGPGDQSRESRPAGPNFIQLLSNRDRMLSLICPTTALNW